MPGFPESSSGWSTFCSLCGGLVQWTVIPKQLWHSETCWQHRSRCAGEMIWTWIDSVSSSCMDCCLFVWGTTDTVWKLVSREYSHPAAMAGMPSRLVFSLCKDVGLFVSDTSNTVWFFFIWESSHLQPRQAAFPHQSCSLARTDHYQQYWDAV